MGGWDMNSLETLIRELREANGLFNNNARDLPNKIEQLLRIVEVQAKALEEFAAGESQWRDGVECMHAARQARSEVEQICKEAE